MDLLSAYSVLDAVCSLSCEGVFNLCVSVKEFEAPRSSEDPCVGHTAGKSRIQNTGPNQSHSKAKSHLQSLL